jgi:hypothetical protein
MGDVPVALAANVATCPIVTVWLAGWDVIEGATAAVFTVKVAVLLVALPAELVTINEKADPLSAVVVTGVV